jgi:hypothetical protein
MDQNTTDQTTLPSTPTAVADQPVTDAMLNKQAPASAYPTPDLSSATPATIDATTPAPAATMESAVIEPALPLADLPVIEDTTHEPGMAVVDTPAAPVLPDPTLETATTPVTTTFGREDGVSLTPDAPVAPTPIEAAPAPVESVAESVQQDVTPAVSEETAATVIPEAGMPDIATTGNAQVAAEEQKPSLISRLLGLVGI